MSMFAAVGGRPAVLKSQAEILTGRLAQACTKATILRGQLDASSRRTWPRSARSRSAFALARSEGVARKRTARLERGTATAGADGGMAEPFPEIWS
ncbi:hypothetical protein ABZU76_17960 [Amycolatopsis sp. NPDC005232]|uniref:hypothetical protein n=1 Tax=Amycolatopsis sp. NPDC005232 TaxID=3157027 RepID=UPI0033A6F681